MIRTLQDGLKEIVSAVLVLAAVIFFILFFLVITGNAAEAQIHRGHHIVRVDGNVIGGRPSGCPSAYCGCGLRKFLGLADASLNLAWEWARKFRHTYAAPGMAAVRRHHVMLLVSQVNGTIWTVRDYNGGRHLSWIHERDTRGYLFVDPSSRLAMR